MDVCHWTRAGRVALKSTRVHTAAQALGGGTNVGLAQLVSALKQRLQLLPETAETFIYLAMIRIMVRRLAW